MNLSTTIFALFFVLLRFICFTRSCVPYGIPNENQLIEDIENTIVDSFGITNRLVGDRYYHVIYKDGKSDFVFFDMEEYRYFDENDGDIVRSIELDKCPEIRQEFAKMAIRLINEDGDQSAPT